MDTDPDVTPKYRALCRIDRDKETYLTGSLLSLPDETAARLLATDPPAIERVAPPVPAVPVAPAPSAPSEVATRANAKATIERVQAAATIEDLLQLQEEETAHADGARSTVLAAIDKRLSALADEDATSGEDAAE